MNSQDFTPIVIATTSDDRNVLESLSQILIEKKLAACVQISGPIISCYRWEGQVESSEEWLCVIKSSKEKFSAVEYAINELHNYDEPQLYAIPIIAGSDGYLNWMQNNLSD